MKRAVNRKLLIWPATGFLLGTLISINPFYKPDLAFSESFLAWCVGFLLVLVLPVRPAGARIAALLSGLFLAVPCFVREPPLIRAMLMTIMFIPFVAAGLLLVSESLPDVRSRLALLFSWGGTHRISCSQRRVDWLALFKLTAATAVLAIGIAAVKMVPASGAWLLARWLAGGIMVFAFAEMATAGLTFVSTACGVTVPALMLSPCLSASINEFWTKRWNIFASQKIFRPYLFVPIARLDARVAVFAVFFVSGVVHVLLAFMAMGQWGISIACGAFFVVQPLLIAAERWLNVRRWPVWSGRLWTLAALAITSPLFVEPALQIIERSWGSTREMALPAVATLGFVVVFCVFVSLGSLAGCSRKVAPCKFKRD